MNQTQMKLAAAARGDKTFDTGVPCKNGHLALRYTSTGACLECLNPTRTKPRVTADVRYISRAIPFAIDRRIATSETRLNALDAFLQDCVKRFTAHTEENDMDFPMWCFKCEGRGKLIDPKAQPAVQLCPRCKGHGVEEPVTEESLQAARDRNMKGVQP